MNRSQLPPCESYVDCRNCCKPAAFVEWDSIAALGYYCNEHRLTSDVPLWSAPWARKVEKT